MKRIKTIGIIFVVANIIDIGLTWAILNAGGYEVNPIMATILSGGWLQADIWKSSLPCIVAAVLIWRGRLAMLSILAGASILIVIWNSIGLIIS